MRAIYSISLLILSFTAIAETKVDQKVALEAWKISEALFQHGSIDFFTKENCNVFLKLEKQGLSLSFLQSAERYSELEDISSEKLGQLLSLWRQKVYIYKSEEEIEDISSLDLVNQLGINRAKGLVDPSATAI